MIISTNIHIVFTPKIAVINLEKDYSQQLPMLIITKTTVVAKERGHMISLLCLIAGAVVNISQEKASKHQRANQ